MTCNPQILLRRRPCRPRISVILIDWGVRESFHTLHYLNRQTANRTDYELIWLEFYNRKPAALQRQVADNPGTLDQWIVLGYPNDFLFHKHRVYNAGLLAATGEVCVICDSDAVYRPTFIETLIRAFEETPEGVFHLDEVRNDDARYYPFNYPSLEDILGPGCFNWDGATTTGLATPHDRIHGVNYGACMAARRRDLLAIGGADEHLDYLGYICGPYEMTFRLAGYYGRQERWLTSEYLYHTWHPNTSGINTDYQGPTDGRGMSLRALDARASFRVKPYLPNPMLRRGWWGKPPTLEQFLDLVKDREEPAWKIGAQPLESPAFVYFVDREFLGWNTFHHAGAWYAVARRFTSLDPRKAQKNGYPRLLRADTRNKLLAQILDHGEPVATPLDRIRPWLALQPFQQLPLRAWRKSRRLFSSLRPGKLPWQPSTETGEATRMSTGA